MLCLRIEHGGETRVIGGGPHFGLTVTAGCLPMPSAAEHSQVATVVGNSNLEGMTLTYWPFAALKVGEELTVTVVESDHFDPPDRLDLSEVETSVDTSEEMKRRIREAAASWGWTLNEKP